MAIYDGLDAADKTLADLKADKLKVDKEVAAMLVKAGEGADEVYTAAVNAAREAGVKAGSKAAGGGGAVKTARVEEIKKQIVAMEEKYKNAAEMHRHVEMVAAKNHINKLRNELNMLDAVAEK